MHWKYLLVGIVIAASGAGVFWWSRTYYHEADLMFHVKLYGLPEALAIVDAPSQTFEVRVRGPRSVIDPLLGAELTYPINLGEAHEGVGSIKIESERLPLPPEVTVLEISTGDTTLHLENTAQKTLSVNLHVTGKPAFGYTIAGKRVSPQQVTVRGPASKVESLDAVPTHPIDINGATEPVHKAITLDLPEGVTAASEASPFSAVVSISEERTEKIIDNIPVLGRNCRLDHVIQPEKIRLTVNGAVRAFSNPLYIEKVQVYLDLANLKPGVYVKPANIHLPDGIRLVQADPQVFTVQILQPTTPDPSGD